MDAKKTKSQKKTIAKKAKTGKLGFVPILSIGIIVAIFSIQIVNNLDLIGKNSGRIEELKQQHNHKRIKNEALRQKVDAPIDDEYIREIMREKGYRDIDEDVYYLNEAD